MNTHKSLRGLYDLKVMLTMFEIGRPAKMKEIEEKAQVPHPASITVSMGEQQGYIDHDADTHTWTLNAKGLAHLHEASDREALYYREWLAGLRP